MGGSAVVSGGERLARLRLVPFAPAAAPAAFATSAVPVARVGSGSGLPAARGVGAVPWCVPGVRVVADRVVSPVVRAVLEAVQVLAAAPRSGSVADVAAVLSVGERLRGVGLAELAELDAGGKYLAVGAPSAAVWLRDRPDAPVSDAAARGRVHLARRVAEELPELGALLQGGGTTLEHVQAAAAGTAGLDRELVRGSAGQLCALVRSTDPGTVRGVLAQRAAAVRPQLGEQVAARRHQRRGLWADEVLGDHVAVAGSVGIQDGQVLLLGLDLQVAADRQAGDTRSLPQRRADALVQWAREAATRLAGPGDSLADDAHTVRSSLLVTCTLQQLQDLNLTGEHTAGRHHSSGPPGGGPGSNGSGGGPGSNGSGGGAAAGGGEPAGGLFAVPRPAAFPSGSPLTGQALRRLACDATLTLLIDGQPRPDVELHTTSLLHLGRASRTVTGSQWKALVARDRRCVVKGCQRRPAQCEAHHVKHWADGGRSDLDNLVLLCHLHHHDHHDRGHTLRHHDGRWLTPTGWGNDPP